MNRVQSLVLRAVRRALREIDARLCQEGQRVVIDSPAPDSDPSAAAFKEFLLTLDSSSAEERAYLMMHLNRLATTLSIVPRPLRRPSRALELGCYMQMTPALKLKCGYEEIRGAYFGQLGLNVRRSASIAGREVFACDIDLFDVESDMFPYPDDCFDLVLACEIIEHLERDPMHMLLEISRVLTTDGKLLITTPNSASISSIANLLQGNRNAQVFSSYPLPEKGEIKGVHVREYTSIELQNVLNCAGFRIQQFFTTRCDASLGTWVYDLLRNEGFTTDHRGEQIYCIAAKSPNDQIVRYPDFIYAK